MKYRNTLIAWQLQGSVVVGADLPCEWQTQSLGRLRPIADVVVVEKCFIGDACFRTPQ